MTRLTTLFLCLAFGLAVSAKAAAPGGKANGGLYMFGLTTDFNDSTVCFTSVMRVDGAVIDKKTRFLPGCSLYGNQLKEYVEAKEGGTKTPIVFYEEKRGKLEQTYVRIRRRLKASGWKVSELGSGDFAFGSLAQNDAPAPEGAAPAPVNAGEQ